MQDPVRRKAAQILLPAIEKLGGSLSAEEISAMFADPPQSQMGDLAFPCFILSKQLKKSPADVAKALAADLAKPDSVKKIEAAGPYLNLMFIESFLGNELLNSVQSGDFFKVSIDKNKLRTMVEYSQPNTHKEMHVGHMRNACLGDALVRILKFVGTDIISSTFPGDVGTHVAKCLWYMKFHNSEPIPEKNRGEWLGRMYSRGHIKLEDEEKTDKGETNKAQLTEILKQLEAKQGPFFELWKETRQWSIDLMNQVYAWVGIEFDRWYWESEVDSPSVQYVKELYKQGKLIESKGTIGMDLEAEGLGFCMLLKSDGTGLYATKDIELARRKFTDFKIQKNIVVVDMRQALHFRQVFKTLEKLGFEQAKDCFHLQYNFVELPDGAMSSRKGNIVPIMDLVRNMQNMVKDQYLARYQSEWDQKEIDLVAQQVAQGAIKYGMTKIDTGKKIVFDMPEWLKIDGDSGPFIQYSAARINSLCKKLEYKKGRVDWSLLVHPAERQLMQSIMNFHAVCAASANNYKPSLLCTYLFETARRFNLFYHECPIGGAETKELKEARLALSYCLGSVIKQGLLLLGIPTPDRM